MPFKLPPLNLRLLQNPSFPLSMKPKAPSSSSRAVPALARIFPFKLKYNGTALTRPGSQFGTRGFSSRRVGSSERVKSLIEDEAELSDWVSELRPDSHKGLLTSDEEGFDDEGDGFRGRGNSGFSRGRGGRYSMSEDDDVRDFRGGGRGNVGSFRGRDGGRGNVGSLRGRGGKRGGYSTGEDEEVRDFRGSGRENVGSFRGRDGGRGNVGSLRGRGGKRGGYSTGEDEEVPDFRGGGRGNVGSSRGRDGGRGDVGSLRGRGGRGNMGSLRGRGGTRGGYSMSEDEEVGDFKGGRGLLRGRGGTRGGYSRNEDGRGVKRKGSMMDDEDEEDEKREMGGLGDLLSGEESDDLDNEDDDEEVEEIMRKSKSSLFGEDKGDSGVSVGKSVPGKSDSFMSASRFDQCTLSPLSLKGIKDAGFENMTVVQEATLPVILKGKDVMAKAKTGTGKTVAFLLPAIEVVVKTPSVDHDQRRPPILVLVVCPTRELATQAATEANALLKYHSSIGVQVVIGGTRLTLEQKRMQANPCQVLVATPGRLRDHIENTAGFATRLMGVKVLVLDEADHLLDMGFRKDIEKIIAAVPKQRQTLLFSATIPDEVRQISHVALKRDHEFINTVQEGSGDTHSKVRQMHLVVPVENHFPLLYALLREHISDNVDYKVLVFCTTAMVTRLVADLLGELNMNVREIHSRKPQSYRTRVSDEFRKSKGLILVTSDVSARGVDYPDVTFVIQFGVPSGREQYIHRLGRTGRKGKEGEGILLLAPWEDFFLSTVKDLPITKSPVPSVDPDTRKKVERALSQVEMKNKEAAYQSWLGYYNSNKKVGKDKYKLVELANEFSRSMGLDNPPAIPKLVLGKMGLKNIPGLRTK